jgi:hypothetical protein
LILFVTFAGNQHHVVWACLGYTLAYGHGAISLFKHALLLADTGSNIGDDQLWRFAPGVVTGNYKPVCQAHRHLAHQRAFAFITIAAGAKHTPQAATAMRAGRGQGLLQRVWAMRKIHDNQGRVRPP